MELYHEAAKVIKSVISKTDSLKSLVFSSNVQNKKALYAITCETLKYRTVLQEILDKSGRLKDEKFLTQTPYLGLVLLYEHLLGKGIKGKYAVHFKRHKHAIHTQSELMKIRGKVTSLKQLVDTSAHDQAISLPKYGRINTLMTTTAEICQKFVDTFGYKHVDCDANSFRDVVVKLHGKKFTMDPHIPDLLVFPPNTDFHDMQPYKNGKIIVQDKASCFPAFILSPPEGASVIDSCAAPGNKTSHIASIIGRKGTVYAFDKSQKRLATLRQLMQKAGAACVKAECRDFLGVDPHDVRYTDVGYILVDPSCSGSGMMNRVLQHTDEGDSHTAERLDQLSQFQISILTHALSFPGVKRVVYSTCSIHEQENESVVEKVLSTVADRFKLQHIMPDWLQRGLSSSPVGEFCIRMSSDQALTNGFFVACFELQETDDLCSQNKKLKLDHSSVTVDNGFNVEDGQTDSITEELPVSMKRKKNKANACKKKRKKNKERQ